MFFRGMPLDPPRAGINAIRVMFAPEQATHGELVLMSLDGLRLSSTHGSGKLQPYAQLAVHSLKGWAYPCIDEVGAASATAGK